MRYPPKHHQENNQAHLEAIISKYGLGTLISTHANQVYTSHLPVILSTCKTKLLTHIDAANPQNNTLTNGKNVTVIFNGPEAYISPATYASKQLPTWNYIRVHIKGNITEITNPNKVKESLVALSKHFEPPKSNALISLDDPRLNPLLPYIKSYAIKITSWEGKFKLSQDKSMEDQLLALQALLQNTPENSQEFIRQLCDPKK